MKNFAQFGILLVIFAAASCNGADNSHVKREPSTKCDKWEKVLSAERKESIVFLVEEGCSGLVNVVKFSIDVGSSNGSRTTVFKYEDASWSPAYHDQATPSVEWLGSDRLVISIGAITAIEKQLKQVGGINVEYKIGHVLSKEAPI